MISPHRRDLLASLSTIVIGASIPNYSWGQGKVARIGYLANVPPSETPDLLQAFRVTLRQRGHIEGASFTVQHLQYHGNDLGVELSRQIGGGTRASPLPRTAWWSPQDSNQQPHVLQAAAA